jgi:hypothetical protein
MSKEAVGRFVEAVNASPELVRRCRQVVEGSSNAGAFAALGKELGFDFSAAEAEEHFKGILGATKPPMGLELSHAELEKASAAGSKMDRTPKGGRDEVQRDLNQSVTLFRNLGKPPAWTFFQP